MSKGKNDIVSVTKSINEHGTLVDAAFLTNTHRHVIRPASSSSSSPSYRTSNRTEKIENSKDKWELKRIIVTPVRRRDSVCVLERPGK